MDSTGTGTGNSSRDSAALQLTLPAGTGCSSGPTWEDRIEALTHILTHQTLTPSLHSQFFIARRVPCFLPWSFPPFLCPSATSLHLWSFTLFLSRASRLGFPRTTWRSLCPFQLPPPCIVSSGVEPAPERWGPEECGEYARKRFRRGRFGVHVPQVLLFVVPNVALLSLTLLFKPLWRKPG